MVAESTSDPKFDIGHVLFIDIVGFSKFLINEQSELIRRLNEIVRGTDQFRAAESEKELISLPTGDGMALVFRNTPEAPAECALEISQALKNHPELRVRMGIHSGPVNEVVDVNERANIAGAGMNMAQRVMDCGDAGHILVSKRAADDLAQYRKWQPHLHDLGECEVKHGVMLSVVNLYTGELGNSELPEKFARAQQQEIASHEAIPASSAGRGKAVLIGASVLIAVALTAGFWMYLRPAAPRAKSATASIPAAPPLPSPPAPTIPEKSVAVLPFENLSHDPDNAYFADGIQEEILTRLDKVADLKVISRTSTQRFKSSPNDLPQIAKQLGVAHILEGSVQKSADQVRVNVQLIKAATDAHLWADTFDRKLTDIFAVESEIAKTIAETLQAKLTSAEQHAIKERPTENTEAHQLYLKGRYFWNKRTGDDLKKSIDYFNQAIAADPNYALAYAGVADAYGVLPSFAAGTPRECFQKAKAAVKRALELDDTLAEAHTSLANALCYYDFDFSQAAREFQRAIELNPNYATAHHWYGLDLLVSLGRFDEAIAELKRALELDPLSLIINTDLGNTYYFARRYDEAIEQLRKTLEMDPNFYFTHGSLGRALEGKGALDAAIGEYQKARALNDDPRVLGLLGHAYASSGNKTEAVKILDQLKELSKRRYVSAYSVALVYLGLGNNEEALRWLQESYQDRAPQLGRIKVDSLLDPLRGDPRFEALVAKVFAPKNVGTDPGEHSP